MFKGKFLKRINIYILVIVLAVLSIIVYFRYFDAQRLKSNDVKTLSKLCGNSNGFTCTGMAYDGNHFYIGNIGKETPETNGFHSEIMICNNDFTEIIDRIDIGSLFPDMEDVQGIAIDTSDNSIYFCSFSENLVRHIDNNYKEIDNFSINQPTGIAYDKSRDCLWVLTYSEIVMIDKETTKMIKSYPCNLKGQDQLFWDEKSGNLYLTSGLNYKGTNYVYELQTEDGTIKKKYNLNDSYAIEGIVIDEGKMYIANDGYYHNAKVPVNQINIYNLCD